ncbi:MAG TPA: class I SAM-dependent methyltransferase [Candidatus Limnocylindrales bacterium]|nr:class I SAM-dependent methyltransferase [Candidatus Limnocylindrales bacterium]
MIDEDGHFGEDVASVYDDIPEPMVDGSPVDDAVKVLADLSRGGRALELAIGTGRVAVPLASLGVDVAGIELSRAMLRRLRAKPHGDAIPVAIGDMTTTTAPGPFSLTYLVFNTIANVTTQAGQVAVFRNAAAHLAPGGRFLIECSIPELRKLPIGATTVVFDMSETHIGIDEYDVANQGLVSHHFSKVDGRFGYSSGPFRYVWPAELDLMAELAGLRLWERWGGWDRRPFENESRMHISIWEKPA